jgi:RimJ/RimL family protein N-acetyltransferase
VIAPAPAPAPAAYQLLTDRLLVRCYAPEDAAGLKEAIDSSLDHLQQWMPWAIDEPSSAEVIAERVTRFRVEFLAGRDWTYAIFAREGRRILGGTGLHPRRGPGVLEIGYWLRVDETGRGYMTEAVSALTRCAFHLHHVDAVEIRCDPGNAASARIPERLGFRLRERVPGDATTPNGGPRDTLVWELRATDHDALAQLQGRPILALDVDGAVLDLRAAETGR